MNQLREAGSSDKYFFYRSGAVSDFDCRMHLSFHGPVDLDALQRAADGAMQCLPSFAVRPVLRGGTIFFEENHAPVALFPDDGSVHYYGTDDMNGHLLCLLIAGRTVTLSFFHGLSDSCGIWNYVLNLVRLYAAEMGENAGGVLCTQKGVPLHDPYGHFADGSAAPQWKYESERVFAFPKENYSQGEYCGTRIGFSTKEFLDAVHLAKTTFLPLITTTISDTVMQYFDTGGQDVVARSTVDLRSIFNASTLENFSDSFLVPLTAEEGHLRISKQCEVQKTRVSQQLVRENFYRKLAQKVEAVKVYEHKQERNPYEDKTKRRITYSVLYPGKMDLPGVLQNYVDDVSLEMCARYDEGFMVIANTFGDRMLFNVFENDSRLPVAQAIMDRMTGAGIGFSSSRIRSHACNLMEFSSLKRID